MCAIGERGLGWVPVLRPGCFSFQRAGGYQCVGADVRREAPVDFWIKLPLSAGELQGLGHSIPALYPELTDKWDSVNKLWRWVVPALEDVPDVAPAIELTSHYQPATGPMPIPTS